MKATTFAKNVDMKINFLILSTTLFLFACQSESNKQEAKVTLKPTENVSEKQISAEQVSVELNAIASFLGGNQPKSVGD